MSIAKSLLCNDVLRKALVPIYYKKVWGKKITASYKKQYFYNILSNIYMESLKFS